MDQDTLNYGGWAERQVIMMAGIDNQDITNTMIEQARMSLERCYYLDLAARDFANRRCAP